MYTCLVCGGKSDRNDGKQRYCFSCYIKLMELNFESCNPRNEHLTYLGFNDISRTKSKSYVTIYRKTVNKDWSWCDILKHYNRYDNLVKYVCDEFILANKETGIDNVIVFAKRHKYITDGIVTYIGINNIKIFSGFDAIERLSKSDIIDEYVKVRDSIKDIPTYNEFFDLSKVSSGQINTKFGGYEKFLLENFPNDVNRYAERRSKGRSINTTNFLTGRYELTNEELIEKYKLYIDGYYDKYGVIPSTKTIRAERGLDLKHIKKRTGMNWYEFIEHIGYSKEELKSFNRSEEGCVLLIANLLNSKVEKQKTFDWLRGISDFPLFCDGYYPEHNLVVEFNGVQHYKPVDKYGGLETFKKLQANDREKERLCKENGLNFIVVKSCSPWYKEEWMIKHLEKYGISVK